MPSIGYLGNKIYFIYRINKYFISYIFNCKTLNSENSIRKIDE